MHMNSMQQQTHVLLCKRWTAPFCVYLSKTYITRCVSRQCWNDLHCTYILPKSRGKILISFFLLHHAILRCDTLCSRARRGQICMYLTASAHLYSHPPRNTGVEKLTTPSFTTTLPLPRFNIFQGGSQGSRFLHRCRGCNQDRSFGRDFY